MPVLASCMSAVSQQEDFAMRRTRELPIDQGEPLIPILNLVCMLIPLLLYGAVFVKFKVLDVQPPRLSIVDGDPLKTDESLKLQIFVAKDGFHLNVNPIHRKAWMTENNLTPDIPRKDDQFDFEELHRKLVELKNEHASERQILIGAEDDIEYDVLIKLMDFTRGTPSRPLFPVVQLSRSMG
jgi:biopolymer transport protein ExbD